MKNSDDKAVTPFSVGMRLGETWGMQSASADDPPATFVAKMIAGYREIATAGKVELGAGFVRALAERNIAIGVELLREAERMDGSKIACLICDDAGRDATESMAQPMHLVHKRCLNGCGEVK